MQEVRGVLFFLVQPTKTIQIRHEKLNECKCQRQVYVNMLDMIRVK